MSFTATKYVNPYWYDYINNLLINNYTMGNDVVTQLFCDTYSNNVYLLSSVQPNSTAPASNSGYWLTKFNEGNIINTTGFSTYHNLNIVSNNYFINSYYSTTSNALTLDLYDLNLNFISSNPMSNLGNLNVSNQYFYFIIYDTNDNTFIGCFQTSINGNVNYVLVKFDINDNILKTVYIEDSSSITSEYFSCDLNYAYIGRYNSSNNTNTLYQYDLNLNLVSTSNITAPYTLSFSSNNIAINNNPFYIVDLYTGVNLSTQCYNSFIDNNSTFFKNTPFVITTSDYTNSAGQYCDYYAYINIDFYSFTPNKITPNQLLQTIQVSNDFYDLYTYNNNLPPLISKNPYTINQNYLFVWTSDGYIEISGDPSGSVTPIRAFMNELNCHQSNEMEEV